MSDDLRKQTELIGMAHGSALRDFLVTLLERVEALEQPRPFMEGVEPVDVKPETRTAPEPATQWPRWPDPVGLSF